VGSESRAWRVQLLGVIRWKSVAVVAGFDWGRDLRGSGWRVEDGGCVLYVTYCGLWMEMVVSLNGRDHAIETHAYATIHTGQFLR
jgi:hypothetical protein